jgi:putative transposase/transposase-like zinc-binding protein
MTPLLEAAPPAYELREPSQTVLYRVVADHLETFLASLDADPDAKGLPAYVAREFYDYVQCGVLAHGFVRLGCNTCQHELLLAFSGKRRGLCPSCAGRRMAHCASVQGFSLHANTQVPAHRRDQLECQLRYTARGAVSLERLTQDANGELVYTFTHPWSDGTTGIRLSPTELLDKLAALVPLPRMHLVRYNGRLAPHSHLRGAIIPTPRQQGVDEKETDTGSSRWSWARLLKRIFALDMVRCPRGQRGTLRIIAAIMQGEVIRMILRHLKLAVDPPPIAPARVRQEAFAWPRPDRASHAAYPARRATESQHPPWCVTWEIAAALSCPGGTVMGNVPAG